MIQSNYAFALKKLYFPTIFFLICATFFNQAAIAEDTKLDLAPIAVTGNPLGVGTHELVVPVSVLNGRALSNSRESTLGETLNGIPGVTATQFGPNASRPVIRGLDAERVKIMQNGTSILDASSLSFDHAIAIDPLVIEQIDVVRGPAALLYGGSAVGGVVNAIDNRIPTEKLDGIIGRAEARFGGPDSTRNVAAVVDIGNGNVAAHIDIYNRKNDDLDIPSFAVSRRKNITDGTPRENKGKLMNSSAQGDGGALGASITFDNGYLGASYSELNNNYGTVADEVVRIDIRSKRWDFASEIANINSPINRVKVRLTYSDYQHVELEGAEIGTSFSNRGLEGNIEEGHRLIGNFNGVLGLQFSNTNFSALGEEAFVPSVNTQNQALYIYEELPLHQNQKLSHKITFGARLGRTSVDSKDNATFGAGQNNSFNPNSVALGGLYSLNQHWSLTSNLSHNERAPSYFELYANGAHLATGQFELGNSNFDKEKSNGIDAQIRWKAGDNNFSLSTYYTRFSNFIALFDTGNSDAASGLAIAQFTQVPAVFKGLEGEGKFKLSDHIDLNLRGDYVNARDKRNNNQLPRIAPLRLGAGLQYSKNHFSAKLDMLRAFKQNKLAENELTTDGYTNISALIAYKLPVKYNIELFAKANNLLNDEIREHASILKDIAPAGARSVLFGLRGDF